MPTSSFTNTKSFPTIVKIETFIPGTGGDGGDYHRQKNGHWILDGGKAHCEKPGVKCVHRMDRSWNRLADPVLCFFQMRHFKPHVGLGAVP